MAHRRARKESVARRAKGEGREVRSDAVEASGTMLGAVRNCLAVRARAETVRSGMMSSSADLWAA
jgi:hypothetical protein